MSKDTKHTPQRMVRVADQEWDRFAAACARLERPVGVMAGRVLTWWATQTHEVQELIAGVLAAERIGPASEKLKQDAAARARRKA